MAFLGNKSIDDSLLIAAQTKNTSGTPTDADSLPTYQIYEQGGTTAITSGTFAKRDDAGTTGYYEGTVTLSTANGYEVGKQYYIRKLATVSSQAGIALDTFVITNAGATAFASLTGWPTLADVQARFTDMGLTPPADDTITACINACVTAWEDATGFDPFLGTGIDETHYYVPRGGKVISFMGGLTDAPTSLTINGNYSDSGVYENGTDLVVNRDYTLLPMNALSRGKPYTHARLARYWSFANSYYEWASIKVVAPFGYATTVPADAWEAIMRCALSLLMPLVDLSLSGGLADWHEADVSETYIARGSSPISQATDYFEKYENSVLLGYKMERMNFS